MFPHRDYYRSVTTMRSLPIAIKSSNENSWTSILVHSENSIESHTDGDSTIPTSLKDEKIGPYEHLDTCKIGKRAYIKQQLLANLETLKVLNFLFHLLNILQYFILPYIYVFCTDNFWACKLTYWFAFINDIVYFIYTTVQCKQNGSLCEWSWNLFLILPLWMFYEQITERKLSKWIVGNIDLGFFLCRCWSCPLRLYWTIHPVRGLIGIATFCPIKVPLKLGFYMIMILHGFAIVWGITVHVIIANGLETQFLGNYGNNLHFAAQLMSQNATNVQSTLVLNLFIIALSTIAIMFCLYLETFLFISRDMRNKRLVKLQQFTHTLVKLMQNDKNNKMADLLLANHQNVRLYKRAVSVMECNKMLKEVNWTMVKELLFDVHLPALKAGAIFSLKHKSVDPYLRYLSSKMKRECYNACENICRKKESIDRMVVIVFGYVQILAEDNTTPMIFLGPGTCLNQSGFLLTLQSKATVRCVTHVRVLTLSKKQFLTSTLIAFPEIFHLIYSNFKSLITESKMRKRTMMMKPPQVDNNMAEKANTQLYKLVTENIIAVNVKTYKRRTFDENYMLNKMWNYLIVATSVVIAIVYPYYAVFRREFPYFLKMSAIAMEVLLFADVILTMITYDAPRRKNKVFTWNCVFFRKHLLELFSRWSFYLDFFACIYFEHFTYALDPNVINQEQIAFLYYLFKLNRVVKVYKLYHLLWSMQVSNEFYKRLFIHTLMISMLIYYGAAILYLISCFTPICKAGSWFRIMQIQEYNSSTHHGLTNNEFLYSLYMSLVYMNHLHVTTSKDYVDIVLSMCLTFLGWLLLSFVFIDLANLKYLQLKPKIHYKQDAADIQSLSRLHKFPNDLHTRLIRYYYLRYAYPPFYFHLYSAHDPNKRYLSRYLAAEILFTERLAALGHIPFFAAIGCSFLKRLALCSKSYLLPADDIIIYSGNMNKEMFVLLKGVCLCKKATDSWMIYPISESCTESHFGTVSLFFSLSEEYTVRTLTPCWLLSIDGSALQEALRYYPSVNRCLQEAVASNSTHLSYVMDIDSSEEGIKTRKPSFRKMVDESLVNVVSQCKKNHQVYTEFFANEEFGLWRYILLPITIIPWGMFFNIWIMIRLCVSFSYGITCPLMFIRGAVQGSTTLHIVNIFTDVIIGADILILSYLCFVRSNGILITHPLLTIRNYAQNGMFIDVILAIPYEWIYLCSYSNLEVFAMIRCFKILQVYKFFLILAKVKHLEIDSVTMVCEVLKCVSWSILALHVFGCGLIITDCNVADNGSLSCHNQGWLARSDYQLISGNVSIPSAYLLGVYWCSGTLFGLTFRDITTQGGNNLIIQISVILVGIFLKGYYLKSIASYSLVNANAANNFRLVHYQHQLNHLMSFLRKEKIDGSMCRKLRENAIYAWRHTNGINSTELLSRLHTTLLQDTLAFLYEKTLLQVPLFKNMDRSFLRIVALIAKPLHFLPDQIIINVDDVCDEFYIINSGTVHVELARSSYQSNLTIGSIFGYYCKETSSLMSIQATTISHVEVLCIKSIDYFNILKNYPKFGNELKSVLSEYKDFISNNNLSDNVVTITQKETELGFIKKFNAFIHSENTHRRLEIVFTIAAFINALLIPSNFILKSNILIYCNLAIDLIFAVLIGVHFLHPAICNFPIRELSFVIEISISVILFASYSVFQYKASEILRHPYLFFAIIRILAIYRCKYLKKKRINIFDYNLFARNLLNIVIILTITLHWTACGWEILQMIINKSMTSYNYVESLLLAVNLLTGLSSFHHTCHHFADEIFIIVIIFTLQITYCFLFVEFVMCFWLRVKHIVRFNFHLRQLQTYLSTLGINPFQVKHLSRHLKKLETHEYGHDFPLLLIELPSPILNSLKATLYQSLLEKTYVFYGTQISFQRNIAAKLLRAIYYQGETIIHHGAIDKCMYFIRAGSVEIVTINENHTESKHDVLHAGEMFGLAQGLFKHYLPHQFTFKAKTDVEILYLRLDYWEHLLRHFPKSKDIIYNRIRSVQL